MSNYSDTSLKEIYQKASICHKQRKWKEAESYYQKAIEIAEETLGPEDATTGVYLNNFATFYKDLNEYKKAEPLYLKALKIIEKKYGPQDLNTGICLFNIGDLHVMKEDWAEAELYLQRAADIALQSLKEDDPSLFQRLRTLAHVYKQLG